MASSTQLLMPYVRIYLRRDKIAASNFVVAAAGPSLDRHVDMQPAGRGMVGCCPFHEDRTPSFSVDESRGSYHCFGCGASGDVITFMMQVRRAAKQKPPRHEQKKTEAHISSVIQPREASGVRR